MIGSSPSAQVFALRQTQQGATGKPKESEILKRLPSKRLTGK